MQTNKRKRDESSDNQSKTNGIKKQRKANFVKAVKAVIQRTSETKVCDTYQTPISFYNLNPALGDLCLISQGTGDNQRVGTKLRPVGLVLRWFIQPDSAQAYSEAYRILVVQDMRQTTSAPAVTEFLKDITGASSTSTAYLMPKNFENSQNFNVLMDIQGTYGPGGNYEWQQYGKKNMLKSTAFKDVHFKGTSSAITDNSSGRLFIWFMNNHTGVEAAPILSYHCRMYYKDY